MKPIFVYQDYYFLSLTTTGNFICLPVANQKLENARYVKQNI